MESRADPPLGASKPATETARERQARIRQRVLQNKSERLQNLVAAQPADTNTNTPETTPANPAAVVSPFPETRHEPISELRRRPAAEAAPNHTEAAPKHTEAAPNHTEAAPKHTEAAPNHTEATPKHTEAAPNHTEAAPNHTEAASNHIEAVPKNPVGLPKPNGAQSQAAAKLRAADFAESVALAVQVACTLCLGVDLHLSSDAFVKGRAFQATSETTESAAQCSVFAAVLCLAIALILLVPLLLTLVRAFQALYSAQADAHSAPPLAASGLPQQNTHLPLFSYPALLQSVYAALARFFDRLCLSLFVLVVALYVPHAAWAQTARSAALAFPPTD